MGRCYETVPMRSSSACGCRPKGHFVRAKGYWPEKSTQRTWSVRSLSMSLGPARPKPQRTP